MTTHRCLCHTPMVGDTALGRNRPWTPADASSVCETCSHIIRDDTWIALRERLVYLYDAGAKRTVLGDYDGFILWHDGEITDPAGARHGTANARADLVIMAHRDEVVAQGWDLFNASGRYEVERDDDSDRLEDDVDAIVLAKRFFDKHAPGPHDRSEREEALATAARAALPWLTLLGDYIGNGIAAQPNGRCDVILALRRAIGDETIPDAYPAGFKRGVP